MVHKIKKVFTKGRPKDDNTILFAPLKELSKEDIEKYPKKIFSFSTPEGVEYVMRGRKKIPNARKTAIAILDAQESGFSNVAVENSKVIIFIHALDEGKHTYIIENIPTGEIEEELDAYSENYFKGYGFKIVDNPKELEKLYIHSNANKIRLLVFLFILAVAGGMFYKYQQEHNTHTVKAPMPHLAPVSNLEKYTVKHLISIEFMDRLLKEVKQISTDKDEINNVANTRLSLISFNTYNLIQPQVPYYDEEDNIWLYGDDNIKRGGMTLDYRITTQKTYPENNYIYKTDINGKNIYTHEISETLKRYFNPNTSDKISASISTMCLKKALKIGKIKQRDQGTIKMSITAKKETNLEMITRINDILKECNAYVDAVSINGNGKVEGSLYFYYKFQGNK